MEVRGATAMNFTLYVVQGKPSGKKLVFPTGEYYFGRGEECHVRPNSEWVSRQHCLLRVAADGVFLKDLGSRNGTLVNGELLTEDRQLQPGDHIQLGPLVFEVRAEKPPSGVLPQSSQQTGVMSGDRTVEVGDGSAAPRGSSPTLPAVIEEPAQENK